MAEYQQLNGPDGKPSGTILRRSDNAYIPDDPANRDYQLYQLWLDEGNTPDPPEPLPQPAATSDPVTERIEALEARVTALERRK